MMAPGFIVDQPFILMRSNMYGSVLDQTLVKVTEELSKDEDFVKRFKDLTISKVGELVPEFAAKAAEKACDNARQEAGYHNSPLGLEVKARIDTYFKTPEGSAKLEASVQNAINSILESTAVSTIVERYIGERMGILARDAVVRAIDLEKKKSARKVKKDAPASA